MFKAKVEVNQQRIDAFGNGKEITRRVFTKALRFWQAGILPKHFQSGADTRYGYAQRAVNYLKDRRKSGKPSLVFSGSLRNDLAQPRTAQAAGDGSALTMQARVLNLMPNIPDDSDEQYIVHSNTRGFPNVKREIRAVTDEEAQNIANMAAAELARELSPGDESANMSRTTFPA